MPKPEEIDLNNPTSPNNKKIIEKIAYESYGKYLKTLLNPKTDETILKETCDKINKEAFNELKKIITEPIKKVKKIGMREEIQLNENFKSVTNYLVASIANAYLMIDKANKTLNEITSAENVSPLALLFESLLRNNYSQELRIQIAGKIFNKLKELDTELTFFLNEMNNEDTLAFLFESLPRSGFSLDQQKEIAGKIIDKAKIRDPELKFFINEMNDVNTLNLLFESLPNLEQERKIANKIIGKLYSVFEELPRSNFSLEQKKDITKTIINTLEKVDSQLIIEIPRESAKKKRKEKITVAHAISRMENSTRPFLKRLFTKKSFAQRIEEERQNAKKAQQLS
jgi:hypothetical protein